MGDYIVRATAADNQIRAFAATTKELVEKGEAYYCFCTKERLESLKEANA